MANSFYNRRISHPFLLGSGEAKCLQSGKRVNFNSLIFPPVLIPQLISNISSGLDLFLQPPGDLGLRVTSQGPNLFINVAEWWDQAAKDGWASWDAPPGTSELAQVQVCSQPSSARPLSPRQLLSCPGRRYTREEKGARGSESGRGVTGAPQIGHLRCEPSFMFRVCKHSSKLMAQRPELCHLISRVCHLHGHGRTWTVTRGLGPTVLCWPEGSPIALI